MVTKAYACYSLDNVERAFSSSGGIYPLVAKEVLQQNGIVYAACYDNNLNVSHMRIVDEEGIRRSQGSKYVKSSIGTTFKDVMKDIDKGYLVLFVGTPCQCAGIDSLIRETKKDRSKLILIDLVCHGVPGNAAWEAYKKSMRERGMNLISINMRDKSTGWSNYSWRVTTDKGETIVMPRASVSYMNGMISNLFIRPACMECFFKGVDRCSDFTLGDYWGVRHYNPEMDDNRGTSLVLIHTPKAQELFDSIRDRIKYDNANLEKAIQSNSCLVKSVKSHPKRTEFFKRLKEGEDFINLVEELTKENRLAFLKRKTISGIKKFVQFFGIDN